MSLFHEPEILLVADAQSLADMCAHLAAQKEFAFDTEYDSFKRSYGFNLLLMQICDGKKVYVIDPLAIQDLSPLKPVMENREIIKLVYAGSEDMALLKQFDIHIQGVFDVQVAATLCNHVARNLGNLIHDEFGITIDKKLQKSDWSVRPLTRAHLLYVANDVLFLEALRNKLLPDVVARGLEHVLEEENLALEEVSIRQHVPELSTFYYKTFPKSYCDALQAMLTLRDEIARKLNVPPDWVIGKVNLEQSLLNKSVLSDEKGWTGYHPRVRNHDGLKKRIVAIYNSYDPTDLRKGKSPNYVKRDVNLPVYTTAQKEQFVKCQYEPVFAAFIAQYGELTGEYLLRNLKRILKGEFRSETPSRKYQIPYLEQMKALPLD